MTLHRSQDLVFSDRNIVKSNNFNQEGCVAQHAAHPCRQIITFKGLAVYHSQSGQAYVGF